MHQKQEIKDPQWIEKVLMLTKKRKGRPPKRSSVDTLQNENNIAC